MTAPIINTPQTDPQGNPLPAQGAAPGAAPAPGVPSILNGIPSLAQLVSAFSHSLVQNQPPPPISSVVQKAQAAAATKPMDDNAPPSPAPGSLGSKLIGAAKGLMGDLGDASHATDVKGGGWLSGMVSTLNARQERLAQAQKDAILLAKTQAETVALHRNMYRQDAADNQQFVDKNQKFMDRMAQAHHEEAGVTLSDLHSRMKDPDFIHNHYALQTGTEPVLGADGTEKKDKYGNPITNPTYTVMQLATKDGSKGVVKVDATTAGDYDKFLGMKMPENAELTTLQYAALNTQVTGISNAVRALGKSNGKEMTPEEIRGLRSYLADPTIQSAIGSVPGSAYAGLMKFKDNADDHISALQNQMEAAKAKNDQLAKAGANTGSNPELMTEALNNQAVYANAKQQLADVMKERDKVMQFTSQAITPKQIDEYEKKQTDSIDLLKDLQKKADGAHGEDAAGIAASTKQLLADHPEYSQTTKAGLQSIISQTSAAAEASKKWEIEKESGKQNALNAINDDDVDVLVDAAKNYQLDPNKLYSMRKNTNAEFKTRLLKDDPTWSEATYKQRFELAQDLASRKAGSMGDAVEKLNTFTGHTWEANSLISSLQNTKSPLVNKGVNELKKQLGNDKIQPYLTALDASRTEYMNFLNNQHALTDHDKQLADKLISENTSPAAAQAVLREMAKTVVIRARSMNHRYSTLMGGKDIPGLLEPESVQILRNFGIDPDEVTKGKQILNQQPQPQQSQPQQFQGKVGVTAGGKTHYFNTQADADKFKQMAGIK